MFGIQLPSAHSVTDTINAQLTGSVGTYMFPSDRPKYYTVFSMSQSGVAGTPARTTGTIVLPLPENLVDIQRVKYDEKPMSPLGMLSGITGVTVLPDALRRFAFYPLGLAPNDFQTIIFDRPTYKRHELRFKLAPKNYREAQTIRDIIWIFNNAMAPGTFGSGVGTALFTFPNLFNVMFRPNNGWLFKFKPCVLETFAVNYAGGDGRKAFYRNEGSDGDNPPESIMFTMHLLETEYWLTDQFTTSNE
jgi:hypothetical protein